MFLTEEDYKIIESYGVSRELADQRYYEHGWSKERLLRIKKITIPRSAKGYWKQYKSICDANGIKQKTFYARVERGMNPEKASTLPLDTKYHKYHKGRNT